MRFFFISKILLRRRGSFKWKVKHAFRLKVEEVGVAALSVKCVCNLGLTRRTLVNVVFVFRFGGRDGNVRATKIEIDVRNLICHL